MLICIAGIKAKICIQGPSDGEREGGREGGWVGGRKGGIRRIRGSDTSSTDRKERSGERRGDRGAKKVEARTRDAVHSETTPGTWYKQNQEN